MKEFETIPGIMWDEPAIALRQMACVYRHDSQIMSALTRIAQSVEKLEVRCHRLGLALERCELLEHTQKQ